MNLLKKLIDVNSKEAVMNIQNEQQLMEKLGIDTWRNLSKDKVVDFIAMMPEMDKEVMLEIIKQSPEFTKFGKNALDSLNESIEQLSESNSKVAKEYLAIIRETQSIIKEELNKENLNSDERIYIIDQIMRIAEMTREMERDNKNFLAKFGEGNFKAVAMISASAITVLGGRALVKKIINQI